MSKENEKKLLTVQKIYEGMNKEGGAMQFLSLPPTQKGARG